MISYNNALKEAITYLEQEDIMDAKIDAWYLLEYITGFSRVDFLLRGNEDMSDQEYQKLRELTAKRAAHVPLQHLIGTTEFMGLSFCVNEHVLIPRQETELLVEEVLKVCNGRTVLDMCTGSGCIIISLATLGNVKEAYAVDLSNEALAVASKNATLHNANITFIQSDMFKDIKNNNNINTKFDIIVSNPPYIKTEDIKDLMQEVKEYEPYMALDGDEDGLKFYRIIANEAGNYLNEGGYLFLEIGYNQGEDVKQLLSERNFTNIKLLKDYAGLDRIIIARLNANGI
ncbi:peptide chain release factor N(5)-glutamine methyltransferase [Clostridium sp. Marseille-P299]|uniref:peptide chain release factor N(5)-glutamine methyltransferase n=1 Tax=Clostridium sp. Marseille-P299 TaxID=1805477 RepID=UPI0009EDC194|nr:peptide chain release factor N(5)-glutamine methyltransferase [Clostridium sp. Marseille-P299]